MMKGFGKYKISWKEWMCFTLLFLFLYDFIWAIADFENFRLYLNGHYLYILADLVYCGLFSLLSLSANHVLLMHSFFNFAGTDRKRFLSCMVVIVVINIFIAGVFDVLVGFISPDFVNNDVWGTFFLFGVIASLLALIHLLLHYSDIMIQRNGENMILQKKYLRLQLDPHFIFNSLSSLAGMIEIAPRRAEEYVVGLSRVYRYMLRHIEQDYITVKEAMAFTEGYIDLLNLRYDDRIKLEINTIQGQNDDFILALSLQLLIENAVKHNIPKEDTPLYIQISGCNSMLSIKNNRIYTDSRNDQTVESYGIGLQNLKQRYELECGKRIEYDVSRDSFEVRLPLIKRNIRHE